MAEENVKDTPKVTINPITGLPFGGGTINPETNLPDTNPITGQTFGLGLVDSEGKANYGSFTPSVPTLGGKGFVPSNIFTDTYTRYNQEPMENYKKYGVPMGRHFDWDELRARNQSNTETVLNGAGKALVTFGGALLENTIGFFAGLGEMASGGAYYDNAIGKTVDKWNNWAEEALPVYLTKEEQEYSTWEKMGTAHFWADDVLGGMSYTAAAAASIYLAGGGGLLTKGAKVATTAALGRTALYNTTKAVINGSKLGSQLTKGATLTNRLYSASQVLEAGAMMSLAEASVEARETQRTTYDNLVQNYLNENKTSNIDNIPKEKLKEFEEVSYHAGNTNFVMQMPVLMGTNLLMFGRSVSGFKAGSAVNKDVIWNSATEAYVSKLANKGFMSSTLSKLKPVAVQGLNEAFQESYQYGSSAFANSYHIDKYNNNGNGDISKALAAGWDAMGTQEGIESALIGFITGGFFGGGRAITSGQYSNRVEQADKLAGLLNGGTLINAASQYQSANAVSAASANMEMHLKNGNIKGYQDARFDFIAAQSLEMLERGGLEMYIEQLEESSNLSDSEFKKLYGYLETDKHGDPISIEKQSDGKNKHEVIDGIVKKVREFQKTYESINSRFTLPERTTGLPRLLTSKEKLAAEDKVYNQRANLRNQLILDAAGVKDRNRRMSNIQNNIQETADDVYMYNRDGRGQNVSMSNVLSEQQPSHKGVKTWKEPGLKETQEAFVDEQIGVDEQGNPIYAPGAPIDPNVRLEQQDIAEQPDRYDPVQQIEDTIAKLKAVEDQVRQSDPLAADKIAELSKDYIALLTDNNIAIKRYNDLSSNKVLQDQWTEALDVAIEEKVQKNADEEAIKKTKEAKTAKDISDYINTAPSISPEAQVQIKERFEQLKKDENDAYKKYYNQVATLKTSKERLEALEDIDTKDLNESEKEGLRKAINSVTQQMQTEKMKNQSDEVTEEDVEVKETKREIEEAFAPENVGGVESISEDGRVFQIEGTQYYNREDNPLDAIIEEEITYEDEFGLRGGNITIKLQNEQGDTHFIKAPQARVEALKVAILESVQYKVDSNQGIAKQDILDRSELIIKENTKELKPSIKDAKKDSSSLRSEMYGLERSLDELLEIQDQLRTSLIQDDGATNAEINKNSTIKALKKQIKNTKAAITRRRNVLLNRNESITPTISEITAVEQKALNDVNELTRTISELDGKILTAEETVKRTEALMEQYQDDPGSFQQVSKENADAQSVINDTTEQVKQLYNLIEYKKQKLRRLENEKQNRPADPAEQTTPEDARETEKQITDGENPNTTTVPQEERVTVAANLGYQRVNSNNYILNPNTGSFTRIKNATDISIPGHSEVEAFRYRDGNTFKVVDSLTGTILGQAQKRHTSYGPGKTALKQAIETLDQGNTTETFKTIIDQNQKVSPAYEPINTVKAKENSTPSEKRTQKVLTIENGKAKIVEDTPTPGPGQRGGMVVMTQAEVEEHDRQVSKDLSEVISDAAQQEIDENKPYGNTQSIKSYVDGAVREARRVKEKGIKTNVDYSYLILEDFNTENYEEGERQLQEIVDFIDKRARMNKILLDKGKEGLSVDKLIEEVMYKHNTSAILREAYSGDVQALKRYVKRKMSPTQPTTAAPVAPVDKVADIERRRAVELKEKSLELEDVTFDDEGRAEPTYKKKPVKELLNVEFEDDGTPVPTYVEAEWVTKINAKYDSELAALKNKEVVDVEFEDDGRPVPTYAPVEQQIKKSEYEVHVTGDMLSGWDMEKYLFNVDGITIKDLRGRKVGGTTRVFEESTQNGKKVFTILDPSIYRGSRAAAITASMVFDENTSHTLEDVKGNLNAIMDSLMGVMDKYQSEFTATNVNFDWQKLDIKEIATPSVTMEDNVPKTAAPIKPKKVYESNFSVKLANATKTINDFKHMPVDENGIKKSYSPDTIFNEIIEIDDSVLLDPNVMEKQVEFELIYNDWFLEKHPQQLDDTNWHEVPIYVKVDGKRIGKLDTSKSEERQVLVEKLQAGEKVTTKINNRIANNFNWAMTENFERVFFNPNEVMETGQVLLAFTEIETEDKISRPFWTLSEVANSKDQGDLARIEQDILALDRASAKTNYGQVAIVIRSKNNPAGLNRVSPGSTQYLTPKAQNVAIKALEEKNHSAAREIIASSIIRDASDSNTFIEFFLEDDTNMMVYRSPKLNKLVSINEHELSKALLGKTFEFGFVETYDPGTGFTEYRPLLNDQIKNTDSDYINDSLREDFESFLKGDKSRNREGKKYHIDRTLGNTVTPYTSKVTNIQYNSYQEYLFSEKEIGEKRSEGLGHNSIFAVDLVNSNGSFFNNPRVEFGKGDLKGSTAVEITNPVKQIKKISSSEQAELDRIKKEMGWSDDITECP